MFGPRLLPRKLSAALRDAEHQKIDVRLAALRDLVRHARSDEAQASAALARALDDREAAVRAGAAMALADAGISAQVERLSALARDDTAPEVRQMALLALGELSEPSDERAVAALVSARRADLAAERFQALLALHQLGAEAAKQAIIEGSVDPDAEVRRLAFRVAEAEWADAELPEILRARARAALDDRKEPVRCAAGLLLAHFGDLSSKHVLLEVLGGRLRSATHEDEQAAIEAAARLGLVEAKPLLERRAAALFGRDPHAFHARVALARMGDERASEQILRGLSAWSYDARTRAVAAAGRAGLLAARAQILAFQQEPARADPLAVEEALAQLDAEAGKASR